MSEHRITRKELKQQDEFLSTATRLTHWFMQRRRTIGLALLGVLAVVAVIVGVRAYRDRQEQNAAALLAVALRVYNSPVTVGEDAGGESAVVADEHGAAGHRHFATDQEKLAAAIEALQPIVDSYVAYPSGQAASFYLGTSLAALGRPEDAEAALQRARGASAGFIQAMAMNRLGILFLDQGRNEEAVAVFEELARRTPDGFPVEEALAAEARAHEAAGDRQAAMVAYQRIVEDHPGSVYASLAQTRAEELAAELGVEGDEQG